MEGTETTARDSQPSDIEQDGTLKGDELIRHAAGVPGPDGAPVSQPDLTVEQQEDATEWLLSSFDQPQIATKALKLNVGGQGQSEKWIRWVIRSVDGVTLRRLRNTMSDTRSGRMTPETMFESNVRVLIAGTERPDLLALAQMRGVADPAILVTEAFAQKAGLIEQVVSEVLAISGYDDEAIRDATEVAATGNSSGSAGR